MTTLSPSVSSKALLAPEESPSCPASEQLQIGAGIQCMLWTLCHMKVWSAVFMFRWICWTYSRSTFTYKDILQAQSPKGCSWTSPPLEKLQPTVQLFCFSLGLLTITVEQFSLATSNTSNNNIDPWSDWIFIYSELDFKCTILRNTRANDTIASISHIQSYFPVCLPQLRKRCNAYSGM